MIGAGVRAMHCLARALLCTATAFGFGCIPVPIITADRPPDIPAHISTEMSTVDAELLILVITSRTDGPLLTDHEFLRTLVFDEPIFRSAASLSNTAEALERSSLHLIVIGVGTGSIYNRVHEICLIAASGRTTSLLRFGDGWQSSEVTFVDPAWRDQFNLILAESRPATLLPIWKAAPCKHFDWAELDLKWSKDSRMRAMEFLRRLPLR